MNEFNKRTALNYQLRTGLDHQLHQDALSTEKRSHMALQNIAYRCRRAAIRRRDRLIALDLSLAGAALMALGVLIGCAVC